MTPRKTVKGCEGWGAELVETLPDGTQNYRIFKITEPVKKRRRFIADYELRFRELYVQGFNDVKIGEELGFDSSTVSLFRKNKLGLPSKYVSTRRIAEYKMQFLELYNQGLSDGKIGKALGFAKHTVCIYRNKLGLPAHFRFGHNKIVFSDEDQDKIEKMRLEGASIAAISREFGINQITMNKQFREMGLDTGTDARGWIRRENDIIRLWEYLEDHGPTQQRIIEKKLGISDDYLQEFITNLMDIFERFKFAVGIGGSSRGGTKYGGYTIYGDLSVAKSGAIISLKDDPRLIDYIAERIPFKIETSHHAQALVVHLKKQIGTERAREVVESKGYTYKADIKEPPGKRLPIQLSLRVKQKFDALHEDLCRETQSDTMNMLVDFYRTVKVEAQEELQRLLDGLDQVERLG